MSSVLLPPESHEAHSPCGEPKLGPCGEPCDSPCDERCDKERSGLGQLLQKSFYNALDVAFDDVKQEPKRILMIGGCRQRDFAQHIALLLPAADITLIDPDPEEARKAKEDICCRFAFVPSALEALPFEDDTFDLTFAHNFFEFPEHWEKALSEVARVTSKTLMISTHREKVWKFARRLPGMVDAVAESGVTLPDTLPTRFDFLNQLFLYGKVKSKLTPFPWNLMTVAMKPMREEKLTLAD